MLGLRKNLFVLLSHNYSNLLFHSRKLHFSCTGETGVGCLSHAASSSRDIYFLPEALQGAYVSLCSQSPKVPHFLSSQICILPGLTILYSTENISRQLHEFLFPISFLEVHIYLTTQVHSQKCSPFLHAFCYRSFQKYLVCSM